MNACNNEDCDDVPDKPGPCGDFEPCNCGWPPVADHEHCRTCQHQEDCHVGRQAEG